MKIIRLIVPGALAFLSVFAFADTTVRSSRNSEEVLEEIRAFFQGAEFRHPGRPGNLAIEKKVAERFAKSGFLHDEIRFEAPSFLPGRTRVLVDGMPPVRLYPLHPTIFRPGNFSERQFKTKLVYLGRGTVDDLMALKGVRLDEAVALMEFDCADSWQRFLRFGLKGFVFIGSDDYSHFEAQAKVYATEVSVPRFFVGAAEGRRLKEAIKRSGPLLDVEIEAEPSRWQNVFLRDLWVLIPGSDAELKNEVCVFVASMDSNCVVPEMAAGAQSGANLYLLLRLLDEFTEQPPARPVILAAVSAHTQHYLGERMLAWHLLASGEKIASVRNLMAVDMRTEEFLQKAYGSMQLDPPGKDTEAALIEMRTLVDGSTGKKLTVKEPIVALARRDVNLVKTERLAIQRSDLSKEEKERKFEWSNKLYREHVNVLTLFNRVGIRTKLSDLSGNELEILRGYVTEIVERNKAWAELNRRDLEIDLANSRIKDALGGRKVSLVITLDLTWRNNQIGFLSVSAYRGINRNWSRNFGGRTTEIAGSLAEEQAEEEVVFVDTMTDVGGLPQEHFFPARGSANRFFHTAGCPAFSLRNVFVDEGITFTPADTVDNLNGDLVARTTAYIPVLLRAILSERDLGISTAAGRPLPNRKISTVRVQSFSFDALSASVTPELPVPGSVIILSYGGFSPLAGGDVVDWMFSLTDSRASRFFYTVDAWNLYSNAFHFDEDFITVDHVIDAGEGHVQNTSNISYTPSCRLVLFPCTELSVYERNDPSLVSSSKIAADTVILLGANRNAVPRRYGLTGIHSPVSSKNIPWLQSGPFAVFREKDEALKFLLGAKRLALNTTEDKPAGKGFSSTNEIGPDIFAVAARDMSVLNKHRLGEMRGVADELAGDFLKRGDEAIGRMEAAREAADHIGYLQALYEALGCQTKAYGRISTLTNDMLKAIIVYMALLLPFCFFIQRLLFKFIKIEAQMAAFAVLFIVTFFVFRTIHPAFRVAQAPAAIFIAFVMGALGSFVIYILHRRFEGEMKLLFHSHTTMDASVVGYSTVGQKAMLIGVNNMKRRRIRTTLTTGTIVLVTFTMLAFSSVSQKMNPTIVPVDSDAKYQGIFYQWPGGARMDEASMQVFRDMFAGKGEVIIHRWLLPVARQQGISVFRADCDTGRNLQVGAVLGLPVSDNEFSSEMPLLPGGRFFSSNEAKEVIITASAAGALKIPPDRVGNATLTFRGHKLTLVGLMDDEKFRSAVKGLNARSILPIKPETTRRVSETADDLRSVLPEDESNIFFVDTTSLLIVPVGVAKGFGAGPASVSIRFEDDTSIWPHVDQVLATTKAKFYVANRIPFGIGQDGPQAGTAGTFYVGSGYRTSIGGLTRLIIPLIIAATIILNTMLGSVYERKSEIAIYNAIGLNPTHIGLFFFAEALVYSVIGSVGGYLVGQTLAIVLTKSQIITGLNLNFSSLSVAYVILVTIAIVLLSTLYPAIVATRAAVPSGKRRWSMPPHHNGQMEVVFPFVYQPPLAAGVMAYLAEYFSRFTEASIGELLAFEQGKTKGQDAAGRDTYALSYDVALTPFDLGVTQEVTFRAAYDEVVKSYRVSMRINRTSGQDSNWVTTNRPFLERIRKYLMNWRNIDIAEHELYSQQAAESFLPGERE